MKNNKKYEIDMTNGTIMDKLITFSLPLMLSGILQLMFNAVDIIVVGQFSGSRPLAAVGSTSALINLFTNFFIGISLGTNVLAARFFASGKIKEMSDTVHIFNSFCCNKRCCDDDCRTFYFLRFALELMETPDEVIDMAALYLKIYFVGVPFLCFIIRCSCASSRRRYKTSTSLFSDIRCSQCHFKYGISYFISS